MPGNHLLCSLYLAWSISWRFISSYDRLVNNSKRSFGEMLSRASLGDVLRVARKASRSVRLSCALDRQRDALYLSPGALLVTFDKRGVLTAASQRIGRELGAHERSCPDWKHRP